MDRTAWIAVALCVIALVAWEVYVARQVQPHPAQQQAQVVSQTSATPIPLASTPPAVETPSVAAAPTSPAAAPDATPTYAERLETFANKDVELHLTNRGGAIRDVTLLNHVAEKAERVRLNADGRLPVGALVENPAAPALLEFTAQKNPDGSVEMTNVSAEKVTVRKRFFFPQPADTRDNFVAEMDVDFRNDGPQPFGNDGYFVTLGSARPIHATDYATYTRMAWAVDGKLKTIDVNWFAEQTIPIVQVKRRAAQAFYQEKINGGVEWAGMASQFFGTIVTPLTQKGTELWASRFDTKQGIATPVYAIEGAIKMPPLQLQPGQTATAKFQMYVGPKIYNRLAKLEHNEAEIMNFGLWKFVSQFLLNLMNSIHGVVGDYGVAILILTAIIKAVLWPLQNKANRSMRQMSALSPKMQEMKTKYKDDPQRMNQEVMKMYKQYGVNPVGGCVPMMIQIPIFFGLLSMLGQAVELRNARFLWVHDLSQPDTVAHIPGLGFAINILPLCMALTNVWLMRMTPKTGDTMQQRVVMFMPLIFLFFCYNFAAALALYYTTFNLLMVLQLYLNNRSNPVVVPVKAALPAKGKTKRR